MYWSIHTSCLVVPGHEDKVMFCYFSQSHTEYEYFFKYRDYLNFKSDVNNYRILRWTMKEPSNRAVFLDLEIAISDNGIISTMTYQKPMKLYLYIPPKSAHAPGMMKGVIYSKLKRYHWQYSKRADYIDQVCK